MARITVEDCLENIPNRFELVLGAARRAKQLLKGARPLVESKNKEVRTALREVAAGVVENVEPEEKEARHGDAPSLSPFRFRRPGGIRIISRGISAGYA